MSATLNAELYASKTRTAHATFNAEVYVSGNFTYKADANFDTEIEYENDTILIEKNFDTEYNIQDDFTQNSDTEVEYTQGE